MEIRGAKQEVLCDSAGDTHSTGKHERQQARNDESKPDSSEPAVPRPRFLFSRNSHAPTLCLCGQMGGSERGSPKSSSLMLLFFFYSGNYEFSASEHGSSSLQGSASLCVHRIM